VGQEKGGLDESGPYEAVAGWFKPGVDRWDLPVVAVVIDNPNRILIGSGDQSIGVLDSPMYRADGTLLPERSKSKGLPREQQTHVHQIMALNADGRVIEDWKQWDSLISMPHALYISPYDPERHVWVVDRDNHQILKFSNDGKKLVMRLGESGVQGADTKHFARPAGLAFLPDGSFYIADGYINSRIIKFDKTGKFLLEWGTKGSGPGQFSLVHSITIDARNRIYASDRNNNRVQVFDLNGKFVEEWPNIRSATQVIATRDNAIWLAAAAGYNRFAKFDLNGKLLTYWGMTGRTPGLIDNPHQFAVGADGVLYIADAWNNRLQKFVPKASADRSRIMAQEYVFDKK
jgi:peptidylamidoglycolate lyase